VRRECEHRAPSFPGSRAGAALAGARFALARRGGARIYSFIVSKDEKNSGPRITNRRAFHDYFISAKLECGIVLAGSEVKSLRQGKAQLTDSYARIEGNRLVLHGCHIDPYEKASAQDNHDPKRQRTLLVHRREMHKLESELMQRGVTLVPLSIYFKKGIAKLELGVAKGKQQYDKRESIKRKEQDRELRRAMTQRR
jgi:SsrA-binding protein